MKINNKNLIFVISIVVIIFLAGGLLILLQQQKMAGTQEGYGRLILNNPIIEIKERDAIFYPQYSNGSMLIDCCGTEDWQRIRVDAITAGGQLAPCMYTHPRKDGTVTLTYKNINLKRTIDFTTAIADGAVTGNNAPVFMDVYVNNSPIQRITQPDRRGWITTSIDTSGYQNKSAEIKLVISSENISSRWFCWDAQTVE